MIRIKNVQECDATNDDSSNEDWFINKKLRDK
jgi:hypothetical protein